MANGNFETSSRLQEKSVLINNRTGSSEISAFLSLICHFRCASLLLDESAKISILLTQRVSGIGTTGRRSLSLGSSELSAPVHRTRAGMIYKSLLCLHHSSNIAYSHYILGNYGMVDF